MKTKQSRADVPGIRQETQYTCMAASLAAALRAHNKPVTEEDVNRVLGSAPLRGARWEELLAAAQYFGMRGTLVVPCTVEMLRDWTSRGIPVIIAWNPEGRPWSHASVVVDVDDQDQVHVMDPNIPDPQEFFRVVPKKDFYKSWGEPIEDHMIVRRPAMAIEREISSDGRQMVASTQCSPENEPMPSSEQEVARWYVRATEELHQAMLNVLGATTAASAARRLPTGRPFDMFVDSADEEYPFDRSLEEMVRRVGTWRDDVRAKFDSWWSGCYRRPSTSKVAGLKPKPGDTITLQHLDLDRNKPGTKGVLVKIEKGFTIYGPNPEGLYYTVDLETGKRITRPSWYFEFDGPGKKRDPLEMAFKEVSKALKPWNNILKRVNSSRRNGRKIEVKYSSPKPPMDDICQAIARIPGAKKINPNLYHIPIQVGRNEFNEFSVTLQFQGMPDFSYLEIYQATFSKGSSRVAARFLSRTLRKS